MKNIEIGSILQIKTDLKRNENSANQSEIIKKAQAF